MFEHLKKFVAKLLRLRMENIENRIQGVQLFFSSTPRNRCCTGVRPISNSLDGSLKEFSSWNHTQKNYLGLKHHLFQEEKFRKSGLFQP